MGDCQLSLVLLLLLLLFLAQNPTSIWTFFCSYDGSIDLSHKSEKRTFTIFLPDEILNRRYSGEKNSFRIWPTVRPQSPPHKTLNKSEESSLFLFVLSFLLGVREKTEGSLFLVLLLSFLRPILLRSFLSRRGRGREGGRGKGGGSIDKCVRVNYLSRTNTFLKKLPLRADYII